MCGFPSLLLSLTAGLQNTQLRFYSYQTLLQDFEKGLAPYIRYVEDVSFELACSRISDCGEDAKVKGTRKVGGEKNRKRKGRAPALPSFLPFYFRRGAWNRLHLNGHIVIFRPQTQTELDI